MIREIITSGENIDQIADNLIRAANSNGGTDNITVVLIQVFADPMWNAAPSATSARHQTVVSPSRQVR